MTKNNHSNILKKNHLIFLRIKLIILNPEENTHVYLGKYFNIRAMVCKYTNFSEETF